MQNSIFQTTELTKAEKLLINYISKYFTEAGECIFPVEEHVWYLYADRFNIRDETIAAYKRSFRKKGVISEEGKLQISGKAVRRPERFDYEVYIAVSDSNEVLYIGSGKAGRHQHCTSGRSHCLPLNKMFFLEQIVSVTVVGLYKTKQEALQEEITLIRRLKPLFNKIYN